MSHDRADSVASAAAALRRFKSGGPSKGLSDLDKIVSALEAALRGSDGSAGDPYVTGHLSQAYETRYEHSGLRHDLDAAIRYAEAAIRGEFSERMSRHGLLNQLAIQLSKRFTRMAEAADLDAAILNARAATRDLPATHSDWPVLAKNLSALLLQRFEHAGAVEDLSSAVKFAEDSVRATTDESSEKPECLAHLAQLLNERFALTGDQSDLSTAIGHAEAAVVLTPSGSPDLAGHLNTLATVLSERFRLLGVNDDLDAAVGHVATALTLVPEGHDERPIYLNNHANHLSDRFEAAGSRADLDLAILQTEAAVRLTPDGHRDRAMYVGNLAAHLVLRFEDERDLADLDAALVCAELSNQLTPDSHTSKPGYLNNLGNLLSERFRISGASNDLDAAIKYAKEALALTPPGHGHRPMYLNNVSIKLSTRSTLTGSQADLNEAIAHAEAAVQLTSEGHADKPGYLNTLASHLADRFKRTGVRADLDAAADLADLATRATPPGHRDEAAHHNTLAGILGALFKLKGNRVTLDRAVDHACKAVDLTPDRHSDKPIYLTNLAGRFYDRFELVGSSSDLNAAVSNAEAAFTLTPEGHDDRPGFQNNLANFLAYRSRAAMSRADLDAAIGHALSALQATQAGHGDWAALMNNLASHLSDRFKLTGDLQDLDGAIDAARRAIQRTAESAFDLAIYTGNLSEYLSLRFSVRSTIPDIEAAIESAEAALAQWHRLAIESEDAHAIVSNAAADARRLIKLLLQANALANVVKALELNKAVRLRSELVGSGRYPAGLDAIRQARYKDVRTEARQVRADLRVLDAGPAHVANRSRDVARLRQREAALRAERLQLEAADPAFLAVPMDFAAVRSLAATADHAIVYLQPLDEADGLLALIVHGRSPEEGPQPADVLKIAGLGRQSLDALLHPGLGKKESTSSSPLGWLAAQQNASEVPESEATGRWLDVIRDVVGSLGRELMMPVARRLTGIGAKRVALVAGQGLGLLPLHAAPIDEEGTPFGDVFETRYAPSATTLGYAAMPAARDGEIVIVGVSNPDGSLPFADLQMGRVGRMFGACADIRHGRAARRDWLLQAASSGDILALSTHATFANGMPEQAHFVLADPNAARLWPDCGRTRRVTLQARSEKLTLNDILRGELTIKRGAVVVADACETGQIAPGGVAEEALGFPGAFLTAGASAVIASLWPVADFSTALLMEEFYRRIRGGATSCRALQEATRWLRRLTCEEVSSRLDAERAEALKQRDVLRQRRRLISVRARRDDDAYDEVLWTLDAIDAALHRLASSAEHPFAHPFHWAPFAVHGNSL